MQVDEALDWAGPVTPLHRPVLLVALKGWFDVGEAATSALRWLVEGRLVETVGSIDPDPFYDFTQERPEVRLDADGERHVVWPQNEIVALRQPGGSHDLVVMIGVEPHVRWRTFADCLVAAYHRLGCEAVVTVGAAAEAIPHTRLPPVVGSTTDEALARSLGLQRPTYQGVTGVAGVLQERFEREGLPAVSLRVAVPHYLASTRHPQSSAALLRHLEHVLGVPTRHAELAGDIERWRTLHDAAVEADDQARAFVRLLEIEYDRRAEASLPTGDDLAAEFERYLAARREDPDDAADDG
jgi:proteasome assembly chaperone (PAC2) family protein